MRYYCDGTASDGALTGIYRLCLVGGIGILCHGDLVSTLNLRHDGLCLWSDIVDGYHWQSPAATNKAVGDSTCALTIGVHQHIVVAFFHQLPWAAWHVFLHILPTGAKFQTWLHKCNCSCLLTGEIIFIITSTGNKSGYTHDSQNGHQNTYTILFHNFER